MAVSAKQVISWGRSWAASYWGIQYFRISIIILKTPWETVTLSAKTNLISSKPLNSHKATYFGSLSITSSGGVFRRSVPYFLTVLIYPQVAIFNVHLIYYLMTILFRSNFRSYTLTCTSQRKFPTKQGLGDFKSLKSCAQSTWWYT